MVAGESPALALLNRILFHNRSSHLHGRLRLTVMEYQLERIRSIPNVESGMIFVSYDTDRLYVGSGSLMTNLFKQNEQHVRNQCDCTLSSILRSKYDKIHSWKNVHLIDWFSSHISAHPLYRVKQLWNLSPMKGATLQQKSSQLHKA